MLFESTGGLLSPVASASAFSTPSSTSTCETTCVGTYLARVCSVPGANRAVLTFTFVTNGCSAAGATGAFTGARGAAAFGRPNQKNERNLPKLIALVPLAASDLTKLPNAASRTFERTAKT